MAKFIVPLGRRIQQIRKAAKLTQEGLAETTGLSVEFISRMERGVAQPSLDTFDKIAKALNVSYKDLMDFKGPVLFKDKKLAAKQKKDYIDSITSALKEMEAHELKVVYTIIKGLEGK